MIPVIVGGLRCILLRIRTSIDGCAASADYVSPPLILRSGILTQLVSPVVVIALIVVEPVDIVVQDISIASRQPVVVSRLSE